MNDPFPLTQCKTLKSVDFAKLNKQRFVMEPKIDGWRLQVEVDDEHVQAWTRTNHNATGKLPRVESDLGATFIPTGTRLDGEVVYLDDNGDPDFNFTSRCMGSGVDVCVDKQQLEERYLSYVVFDILRLGDRDLRAQPYEERRSVLEKLLKGYSPYVPVIEVSAATEQMHNANIDKYGEGSILKDLSAPYAGKRHKSWLKMKAEETMDVRIVGYKEGLGKYNGLIGAITFVADDGTFGNCSGMDDDTRVHISDHRGNLIGRIIEVKHYGKLVDGWRHPQFVRFRNE
jgi:bifunctional non-homologous end joining protein LigD